MNLICFKAYLMRYTNFAKSCIVLAFMLCLVLPFSAVASDDSANISAIQSDVSEILTAVNHALWESGASADPYLKHIQDRQDAFTDQLGYFLTGRVGYEMDDSSFNFSNRNALPFWLNRLIYSLTGQNTTSANGPSNPRNLYDAITGVDDKQASANALLQSILDKLVAVTNSMVASSGVGGTNFINIVPTNIVNITVNGQDILAGNPWWATNSAFAINWEEWVSGVPKPTSRQGFSFPEAFSTFLSSIFVPWSDVPYDPIDAMSLFGYGSFNDYDGMGYTWFDSMVDWQRSNALASAVYNVRLLSALRGVSNAVDDSAEYVVNHLDYGMQDVTNLLGQVVNALVESHGDNPWWWTNSAFATDWQEWSPVVPRPYTRDHHTFPEVVSQWLSARQNFIYTPQEHTWDSIEPMFGIGGQNERINLFTWEDWLATWLRSNMTASSYAVLTSRVSSAYAGTDVDEMPSTNSVLAAYEDALDIPDTSDIQESFSDTMDEAEDKLQGIADQFGRHGSPEIVVIPEFTVGGIHVREYRGSLDTTLTRVAHAVCVFLYTVFFITATIRLIRVEWAFWTTLGHSSEA